MALSQGLVPETRFHGPIHAFVERSGCEVATPVMIVSVGVSEEVSTQGREQGLGTLLSCFFQCIKIVR